ncbi:hypothetical protein ONZ51_g7702 [Trametes cubensis]|uniref:Uncharacterized protein n=1 Tax=Trametes cubensis TaxID=1111947 RepID=A0AAD7X8W7_9APHY|nr:hypothetical protein ONZ51_g7702 [Trametes cubensis]
MSTFADTEPPPSLLSLPTDISLHILALGAERAKWGTVPLSGDAARDELDADFDRPDDKRSEGPGYDTDYHPAKLHPPPEHIADPHSEGEKSLGATQADANRPAEEGRRPHQARGSGSSDEQRQHWKARKASFMEKMKGEAKVLLGKIEGKHEKVEEGHRMMAGEAAGGKA